MTDRYRHVGDHVENLASGQMLSPGEFVPADRLDQADRWLIDEGRLIAADEPSEEDRQAARHEALVARAKELDVSGRTKMTDDELEAAITQAEEEAK